MWTENRLIPPGEKATAGNENTGLIKLIALACMLTDHVGLVFLPMYGELRLIGRAAFPLFAWCVVVGCCHTKDIRKYALRLLLTGILSQPCYMVGLNYPISQINVFATLLLGVLAVWGIRENRRGSAVWAPVLAIVLPCMVRVEYGWKGVALILILYACRRSRPALAAAMTAFCLFWAQGTFTVTSFLGVPTVLSVPILANQVNLLSTITQVQFWAILALPAILWRDERRLRLPKWLFYAAYPGHLLLIGLIRWGGMIGEKFMGLMGWM